MRVRAPIGIVFSVLCGSASGGNLVVHLSPAEQHITQGSTPLFSITVVATSSAVKVMRFASRADLKDNYASLLVSQSGKKVEVPAIISDPGATLESDYFNLLPGHRMTFAHNGSPLMLSKLPVGTYSVKVKLFPDWRAQPVWSNSVSLHVVK